MMRKIKLSNLEETRREPFSVLSEDLISRFVFRESQEQTAIIDHVMYHFFCKNCGSRNQDNDSIAINVELSRCTYRRRDEPLTKLQKMFGGRTAGAIVGKAFSISAFYAPDGTVECNHCNKKGAFRDVFSHCYLESYKNRFGTKLSIGNCAEALSSIGAKLGSSGVKELLIDHLYAWPTTSDISADYVEAVFHRLFEYARARTGRESGEGARIALREADLVLQTLSRKLSGKQVIEILDRGAPNPFYDISRSNLGSGSYRFYVT